MTPLEFVAAVIVAALALAVAIYAIDHFEQRTARKMAKDAINCLRENPMTDNAKADTKESAETELKRLKAQLREAAVQRWIARRLKAIAATELPAHPLKIQHRAESDTWVCLKAVVSARDRPKLKDGRQFPLRPERYWHGQSVVEGECASVEELDADTAETMVYWQEIGPKDARFSTFDEAKKWLTAYLKPIDKEVYFTASGRQVAA